VPGTADTLTRSQITGEPEVANGFTVGSLCLPWRIPPSNLRISRAVHANTAT
jgi:hypothetical protein